MTGVMDYPESAAPLGPDEMEGLRFKHVATRNELDQLEQANIEKGMAWLKRQKSPDILTEELVANLHKQLFGDVWTWAGNFRKTGKNIGVDASLIAVQLRVLLDDVRLWIEHETYSPKELAARFHHKLVYIHPFANGNGRHSRIMADAILTKLMNEPAIDWAGGHRLETMNERRREYIAALKAADKGDLTDLFNFVRA